MRPCRGGGQLRWKEVGAGVDHQADAFDPGTCSTRDRGGRRGPAGAETAPRASPAPSCAAMSWRRRRGADWPGSGLHRHASAPPIRKTTSASCHHAIARASAEARVSIVRPRSSRTTLAPDGTREQPPLPPPSPVLGVLDLHRRLNGHGCGWHRGQHLRMGVVARLADGGDEKAHHVLPRRQRATPGRQPRSATGRRSQSIETGAQASAMVSCRRHEPAARHLRHPHLLDGVELPNSSERDEHVPRVDQHQSPDKPSTWTDFTP